MKVDANMQKTALTLLPINAEYPILK